MTCVTFEVVCVKLCCVHDRWYLCARLCCVQGRAACKAVLRARLCCVKRNVVYQAVLATVCVGTLCLRGRAAGTAVKLCCAEVPCQMCIATGKAERRHPPEIHL